jgi:hypothetical protein
LLTALWQAALDCELLVKGCNIYTTNTNLPECINGAVAARSSALSIWQ